MVVLVVRRRMLVQKDGRVNMANANSMDSWVWVLPAEMVRYPASVMRWIYAMVTATVLIK
jgi:hypothetical protein